VQEHEGYGESRGLTGDRRTQTVCGVSWTVIVSTAGGVVTTLLGVVVGGVLGRRSQERHWLKDTKASAYRALLREYTRAEFDVRRAYLGLLDATEVDWARWGAAVTELSLVADDDVVAAAQGISDILVQMDRYVHSGQRDEQEWRPLQHTLVDAQMGFVNAARRSLSRAQPALTIRVGGPLITGPDLGGDVREPIVFGSGRTPDPLPHSKKTQNPGMKVILSQINFIRILRRR